MNKPCQFTRRDFLRTSLVASAAISLVPRHVLGGPGVTPPSEILTKAVIGVGSMGRAHLSSINPTAKLLAVCDVDAKHLQAALSKCGPEVKGYRDFREVLARKDIDIVHIPTPPHWHALISIAAAKAGKDIWCEKPLSRTIGEGEAVKAAMAKYRRIFRLNTWFRFEGAFYGVGVPVRLIKKAVQNGLFGWPLKVTLGGPTGFDWKQNEWCGRTDLTPQPVPPELDYDFWLGPAPKKPYHPHRVHGTFRGYWDYDGGGLGDMGQHYLDPVQYLLDKDNESPVRIEADTDPQDPDAVQPWRRISIRYADGCEIIFDGENKDKEAAFIAGPEGKLFRDFESDIPNLRAKIQSLPDPEPQLTDFIQAVKTRQKFALNEVNGHRSCTLVNLAKIAVQTGRVLHFDPKKQRFIHDQQANALIHQPMRKPWKLRV
ncbi:MAG TPA: Gfo/Idh/MocA family oxidoreductase [Verrucomicrobiota bacterium]|jgi:predicted dehydrogenase|nr:Gfo/Idh/MocA family oxidoreductase [Verrucomicrobiota bacterium]OQC27136.1 MAG: Inositol 2-dehydrogenase [Verrucomicrobia bacterium ADurb.Bin063]HRR64711.1 Gfo/Idh/MocA family oxidoreductase [Candidatus Paceibacterota bacterium]MBP8015146.1 Gfo/Idh/MocA family oxidoreductase [Verrucomicrobiota bacterium]MDI9371413.1 Gfo/Idh/MocA family oxidoreductase [Verrucomicrobiota bacterium]